MLEVYRSNAQQFIDGAERAARSSWPILLVEGIALILFGILALFIPPLITFGIASSLGWVFLLGGIAALFVYFRLCPPPGFHQRLFLAVLFLVVCFALGGVAKLTYPLARSRYLSGYRGWIRASGVVDLVLAGLMFVDLPETALSPPGLLLGANMALGGIALVVIALLEQRKLAANQTDRHSIGA